MTHSNSRGAGALNPRAKLTNQTAREMRFLRACGYKYQELQDLFGVGAATVSLCVRGVSYPDAGGPTEEGTSRVSARARANGW